MGKRLLSFIAICMFAVSMAFAQKQVTGTVVDDLGEPVVGASVLVKGTTIGSATDLNGKFTIKDVPNSASTLMVSYIGMKTKEVAIKPNLKVALESDSKNLDDVVVTALGMTKSQKAIGYAATTIKEDAIKTVPVNNVTEALAGKVAGVNFSTSQSGPGGATSIAIRSFSSITGSNEPLWVVDGVPMVNNTVGSSSGDNVMGSGVSNLNQDDIETMTILKGAAATALYGSRAANGVVLVTTKSGSKSGGKNFTIEANAGLQWSQVSYVPQMQDKFGQGWNGNRTLDENGSWGPEMDGKWRVYGAIYDNSQLMQQFKAVKNSVRNFFETGLQQNYSVNMAGNTEKSSYYLSYSHNNEDGVIPSDKDKYTRNTIGYRGSFQPTKWLKLSSNVNLALAKTSSVPTDQGTTMIDGLYEMPRNISIADLKDLTNPFNTPDAYYTEYGITNPYWAIENNYSNLDQKKVYGKVQADITPVKNFTFTYRFGFDYSDYDLKEGLAKITADNPSTSGDNKQDGSVVGRYQRRYETNHDFLANYSNAFGDLTLDVTLGVNMNERYVTQMSTSGSNLTIPTGWWDLANAASHTPTESQSKRRTFGVLGDVQLGWKEQLFLDITGRNDWSSTLPKDNNNFFYPGVTASWIFTETFKDKINPAFISFGKLRAAFGKTGNDASPYYTNNTFVSGFANTPYNGSAINFPMSNGTNSFKTAATKGSSTLKPEMTSEWEFGTEIHFLNNRLSLDAAYYDRTTSDMIMQLNADPASGYSYIMTNFGKVNNHGIEIALNATPIRSKDWQWDVNVNFAKNWNKVKELPEELGGQYTINQFSTSADAIYMRAVVGQELGQLYGYEQQYVDAQNNLKYDVIDDVLSLNPEYDASTGSILCGSDGLPIRTNDVVSLGKSTQNKWTGGFGTDLRWKNLSLSAQFDLHYGGYMFSRTKNLMQFTGNGIETLYNDRRAFVVPGSVVEGEDGKYIENTNAIDQFSGTYQDWFDAGCNVSSNALLVSKTYLKLRTLAVGYSLPKSWLRAATLQDVRISFVASNLFTWTPASNAFIDPDTSSYGSDLYGQFGELYSNPGSRKFGFNVKIKF